MQISRDFVYAINLKQFSNRSITLEDTKKITFILFVLENNKKLFEQDI